jgi:hypothetical protein
VDVSALTESYNRLSLALVLATAGRIENRLAKLELDIRYRLLEELRRPALQPDHGRRRHRVRPARARHQVQRTPRRPSFPIWASTLAVGPDGLSSLSLRWNKGKDSPEALPDWMRREWLEPVIQNGEHIGSVLTLPGRRGSMLAGSSRSSASSRKQ